MNRQRFKHVILSNAKDDSWRDEAIPAESKKRDCFASLAMTGLTEFSAPLQMRPDVFPHKLMKMFHTVFHRRLVWALVIFSA